MNGVLIGCIYLPNGNPQPGQKFEYKVAWFERLIRHARALKKQKRPVALIGDYKPTDFDIYPTKSWDDDALLQPLADKRHPASPTSAKRGDWADND